jgi:AcrR family transcriptional regulator
MARRRLSDTSHPDVDLNDEYWLQFGSDAQPPMRLKILYVTFEEVAKSGPMAFNVAAVCDRLGITYPMVNHYFGGRDSLIAEAAQMVYSRYIDNLWVAVEGAKQTPEDRLAAWIYAQVTESEKIGGWGSVLNYPLAAKDVSELIYSLFAKQMTDTFEYNLARLGLLIRDVRRGEISTMLVRKGFVPRMEFLLDKELQALVPTVAWSTLGAAIWFAGRHLPARKIPETATMGAELLGNHVQRIIDMVKAFSLN